MTGHKQYLLTYPDGRTLSGFAFWSDRTIPGKWVYSEQYHKAIEDGAKELDT